MQASMNVMFFVMTMFFISCARAMDGSGGSNVPLRQGIKQRLSRIGKGGSGESSRKPPRSKESPHRSDLPMLNLDQLQPGSVSQNLHQSKKGPSALDHVRAVNQNNGWYALNSYREVRQSLTKQMADAALGFDFKTVERLITPVDINRIIGPTNGEDNRLIHCLAVGESLVGCLQTLLLNDHLDVNAQNSSGDTALHIACEANNVQAIKLLLGHKDIACNAKNNVGDTPLHIACREGHIEALRILSKCPDVDINSVNNHKETPLHHACRANKPKIVKKLLALNTIDVNLQDCEGGTALHMAVAHGASDIVGLLINLDHTRINLNLGNMYGNTPLHFATHYYFDLNKEIDYPFGCLGLLLLELRVDMSKKNNEGHKWQKLIVNAIEIAQDNYELQAVLDTKNEKVRAFLEKRNELRRLPELGLVNAAKNEFLGDMLRRNK